MDVAYLGPCYNHRWLLPETSGQVYHRATNPTVVSFTGYEQPGSPGDSESLRAKLSEAVNDEKKQLEREAKL